MLERLRVKTFTVFQDDLFHFSPGLNVIVGENGAGKSHLLKLAYALIATSAESSRRSGAEPTKSHCQKAYAEKLGGVFRPDSLGRLASRVQGHSRTEISLEFSDSKLNAAISFATNAKSQVQVDTLPQRWDTQNPLYLPTRELLTIYPGFVSLYENRHLEFEETWRDTCLLLGNPPLRGPRREKAAKWLAPIEEELGGRIFVDNGRFYLKQPGSGIMEMPLLAEGLRKLAMLAYLIANGVIAEQGYVFWDEPEANLNPRLIKRVAQIIHALAMDGVQVFIATHSFFLLKELDILNASKPCPQCYIGLNQQAGQFGVTSQQAKRLCELKNIVALDEELAQYDREMEAKHAKHH